MERGIFIAFEGLDGAGKTTQIELLNELLLEDGYDVLLTREPGGTLLGEQVREIVKQDREVPLDPASQLLLFAASFAQKWHEVIKPALEEGKIVLSDRLWYSTVAYQGSGGGLSADYVRRTCLAAFENRLPDAAFFFDLDPQERARRLGIRGGTDAIESQGDAYFDRVREGFLRMASQGDLELIDASGAPDSIFEELRERIAELGLV